MLAAFLAGGAPAALGQWGLQTLEQLSRSAPVIVLGTVEDVRSEFWTIKVSTKMRRDGTLVAPHFCLQPFYEPLRAEASSTCLVPDRAHLVVRG